MFSFRRALVCASLISATLLATMPLISAEAINPVTGFVRVENGAENVSFFYQNVADGNTDLIGNPREVVFGGKNSGPAVGDPAEVAVAHQHNAYAIKYIQFTWFPDQGTWYGISAEQRRQYRLCGASGPIGDLESHPGYQWWYADMNERGMVDSMTAYVRELQNEGYDGVLIDVGGRAINGPYSNVRSTCTSNPTYSLSGNSSDPKVVLPAADAYVRLIGRLHRMGMRVGINYPSAFENPLDRPSMTTSGAINPDMRGVVDWVLHENISNNAAPLDQELLSIQRMNRDITSINSGAISSDRVVQMAKNQMPTYNPSNPTDSAYLLKRNRMDRYVWAMAKLSGTPVVLNTGWDACGAAPLGTVGCNRMGLSPTLTDVKLGRPIDQKIEVTQCQQEPDPTLARDLAKTRAGCLLYRRFEKGFVVVNTSGFDITADVPFSWTCRTVREVGGGTQAGGACITHLVVSTPIDLRGHIYVYTN